METFWLHICFNQHYTSGKPTMLNCHHIVQEWCDMKITYCFCVTFKHLVHLIQYLLVNWMWVFCLSPFVVMAIKGKRQWDFVPGPLTYESTILGSGESFLDCSLTRKSGTLLRWEGNLIKLKAAPEIITLTLFSPGHLMNYKTFLNSKLYYLHF